MNLRILFYALLLALLVSSCSKEDPTPPNPPVVPINEHVLLGNPSNAFKDIDFPDNYLMEKKQYVLSYNNSRGSANWVSWHLSPEWKGTTPRQDNFSPDPDLPVGFFRATTSMYTNTGFDRGHLCPSDDRDLSVEDNSATFLMTNIIPQAPNLNRITWEQLESYCRTLMDQGNELYVIAGGYGIGGDGSLGRVDSTIAGGKIAVPANCFKVIVVLPYGTNDLDRVSAATRVIAVDIPNSQDANFLHWGDYRTTVDNIERKTGLDFLSYVSKSIQDILESKVDNGPVK